MPLKLTIIRQPETDVDGSQETLPSRVFEETGGVIGRDPENDWVLPHKYVSRHHARVHFERGRFYVRDTSQNGVYVNDQLVGQGNSAALTDGDRIVIGDYEILVQTTLVAAPSSIGLPEAPRALFGSDDGLGLGDVLPPPAAPHVPGIAPSMVDLLAPEPAPPPAPWETGPSGLPSEGDALPAVNQPYRAPGALPEIPADWWQEDLGAAPAAVPTPSPTGRGDTLPPAAPPAPARTGARTPAAPAPGGHAMPSADTGGSGALAALAAGLGFAPSLPPGTTQDEVIELAGALLAEFVRGTIDLLRARASIKQEARLEMTTLHATENNPLKFAVTPQEALQRLLSPDPGTGYLTPRDAVVEAMRDLRAHELATLAGLEAAIRGMFERFDPKRLERDFSERSLLASILPAHRKAKCWDLFTQQFRQIGEEAREDFNALFGREFARAYEEQARRLRSAGPR